MDIERQVARHYTRGALESAILDALKASGKEIDRLTPSDLSGADEFHLGWRSATVELGKDLELGPDTRVLDIGSGIGGPARYFAEAYGSHVTGVDLTAEFVEVANALTQRCGLADRVAFREASGLALPFDDGSFDRATLIHVGMNIQDKAKLFAEVRRVLRRGGMFGVYDIMRLNDDPLPFPMPWANSEETSFVETSDTYKGLLERAGFVVVKETDRRDMSLKLGREMRENAARNGAPPLGLHILMGPATPERLGNVMKTLEHGSIAPVEIIAKAV
ncbi:class I SAM-dependent methyltransferase [Microvirga sp. 2MCAF38]|uniref:class I SAM-dependent methyltransferase n=1 Tax=Microvirga sp. 2MCAF38 TaxID=3232989 RepID=UPI003F9C31BE